MNKICHKIFSFCPFLGALCIASNENPRVNEVRAHLDQAGAIVVSVDRGLWKTRTKDSRVDIVFERKSDINSFKLVDWRAKIDWSKWIRRINNVALIRVTDLKAYDRMTIVVMDGDETLYSKAFLRHELSARSESLWDQPSQNLAD